MTVSSSPRRQQVVVGILVHGDRVLLGLRSASRQAYPAAWALPGGHVETGETEVGALRRELREELGIKVLNCAEAPASHLRLREGQGDGVVHVSAWHVRSWRGDPTNLLRDEHERLGWFTGEQLKGPALGAPAAPRSRRGAAPAAPGLLSSRSR